MATHSTLSNSLAGYWPCTEASGTRADSSTANNTLAQTGTILSGNFNPIINTTVTLSKGALYDANSSNFLAIADATKLRFGNTDFSLCFWFNASTVSSPMTLLSKFANETNGAEYLIAYFSGSGIIFDNYPTGDPSAATADRLSAICPGSNPILPSKWYFVVARKRANGPGEIRLNNGDWSTPRTGFPVSGGGFATSVSKFAPGTRVLSGGTANVTPMAGTICNIGAWNRLLNDSECGDLWNGGFGVTYDFSYPDA